MATLAASRRALFDRAALDKPLGALALVMLAFTLAAVARGWPRLLDLPWQVGAHLALLVVALALTPVLLWRVKGSRWHRRLGWIWAVAMTATALVSFSIRFAEDGALSWIHILSAWVLIQAPLIVWWARRHDVPRHRAGARIMTTFALLVAGFFTFPFNRLLGQWLLG